MAGLDRFGRVAPERPAPPTKPEEQRLLATLGRGRAGIVSSYEIAQAVGCHQRSVGFMVNDLRRAGHLIGSAHGEGYYLIDTPDELADTIEHIERRKRGIDATLNALRDSWAARGKPTDDGQVPLW